jgi:hypothetical protein
MYFSLVQSMNETPLSHEDKGWIKGHTGGHVRSPRLDFAHIRRRLSNRKINDYIREGRYGETAQKKLLAADERRKNAAERKRIKQRQIQKLLNDLGL